MSKQGEAAGSNKARKRLLALASAGGHWSQLMMVRSAFADADVTYASTVPGADELHQLRHFHVVPDCNRNERLKIILCSVAILILLLRTRPHVVVTTGALPGLITLALAKRLRARTIWIDSVANSSEFSMAGALARKHADLWLSQWPNVAEATGAHFEGSVL